MIKSPTDKDPLEDYRDKRVARCTICEHRNATALQKSQHCRNCIVRDSFNPDLKDEPEETY